MMRLDESNNKIGFKPNNISIVWLVITIFFLSNILIIFALHLSASPGRENSAPSAVIDSPENAEPFDVKEVVTFDASSSEDPDNDPLSFYWDFGDGETGTGMTTTHTYTQPWVHVITLEVSDGELNDTDRVVIIIGSGGGQNRPPSAKIDSPSNFDSFSVGEMITFDGSGSSDPDEDSLTYLWRFGDGNYTEVQLPDEIVTHSYERTGSYVVTLRVSDSMYSDANKIMIFVNNTSPIADAGEDIEGYKYQELFFDGSNSSDPDRLGSIVNYSWDMGDKANRYGVSISHSYEEYGKFTVILTVTDDNGATDSDELVVTVSNAPPIAEITVTNEDTIIGADIEFDASGSNDPDGYIDEYNFDFGDGSITDWITDVIVTHRYSNEGIYQAELTVRDDWGETSEPAAIEVVITEKVNQPPNVNIISPKTNDAVSGDVEVKGTAADPENDLESVELKFDEGNWISANFVENEDGKYDWLYTWDTEKVEDGNHAITVRAYDGKKYSDLKSVKVKVNNRPTTYIKITEKLQPTECHPKEEVTISGTATYDTNVPVKNTNVKIEMPAADKSWTTETNSQGKYSFKFEAPEIPGEYSVTVFITDGTLQHSNSETLNVKNPPDLYIQPNDITFRLSSKNVVEKEQVKIAATVHNTGDIAAKGTVSFYQDTINRPFHSVSINVPRKGSVLISVSWAAQFGTHSIIVVISDTDPEESDTSNNKASKNITVGKATEEAEDKAEVGWMNTLLDLPILYKYAISGFSVIIIILIIIYLVAKAAKSKKIKAEPPKSNLAKLTGKPAPGELVFKPIDDKDKATKGKQEKAIVKFETIGVR